MFSTSVSLLNNSCDDDGDAPRWDSFLSSNRVPKFYALPWIIYAFANFLKFDEEKRVPLRFNNRTIRKIIFNSVVIPIGVNCSTIYILYSFSKCIQHV